MLGDVAAAAVADPDKCGKLAYLLVWLPRPRHSRVMSVLFVLGGLGVSGVLVASRGWWRAGGCDAGVPGRFEDPDGEQIVAARRSGRGRQGRFRRIL